MILIPVYKAATANDERRRDRNAGLAIGAGGGALAGGTAYTYRGVPKQLRAAEHEQRFNSRLSRQYAKVGQTWENRADIGRARMSNPSMSPSIRNVYRTGIGMSNEQSARARAASLHHGREGLRASGRSLLLGNKAGLRRAGILAGTMYGGVGLTAAAMNQRGMNKDKVKKDFVVSKMYRSMGV